MSSRGPSSSSALMRAAIGLDSRILMANVNPASSDARASRFVSAIRTYISDIRSTVGSGKATEHSYRPALKRLLESFSNNLLATNEPKRVACGAPDFLLSNNVLGGVTIGHLEAKDLSIQLAAIERDSERHNPSTRDGKQLKRYRLGLRNLIFTNHLEFRWYVDAKHRATVQLASSNPTGITVDRDAEQLLAETLEAFTTHEPQAIASPEELAHRLAQLARFIRNLITTSFDEGRATESIRNWHQAFQTILMPDLTQEDFADMFAQTLTYGLFAARCNHDFGTLNWPLSAV